MLHNPRMIIIQQWKGDFLPPEELKKLVLKGFHDVHYHDAAFMRAVINIPSAIIGHAVVTPDTIARFNPNSGPGDPYGGAHDLAQSYLFRPLPGQPSHQTEIPNLYMLGAATWPGHGINGGSGYIVAQKLLK